MDPRRKHLFLLIFHQFFWMGVYVICLRIIAQLHAQSLNPPIRYSLIRRKRKQAKYVHSITMKKNVRCKNNLRLDKSSFENFCCLLHNEGGLRDTKYVPIREQVAIFLSVLSHHKKIRIVGTDYKRSGDTVSKCFHRVLSCTLTLHKILLSVPEPVPDDCDDARWNCFPGCIGALDGTYVPIQVPLADRPRYRSRKGVVSTNVLAACDVSGGFTYALVGWEGSAADGRVLRDAINRNNGLRVPTGTYYLCDNGYTNGEGFLAPYRGVRYHLKEWGVGMEAPQNEKEFFNMKHSQARNVIERSFGQVKKKWAILRSNAFYPLKTQNRIIMCLFLIQNFMRRTMDFDVWYTEANYSDSSDSSDDENEADVDDYIDVVQPSHAWNNFRDDMARRMFLKWNQERH